MRPSDRRCSVLPAIEGRWPLGALLLAFILCLSRAASGAAPIESRSEIKSTILPLNGPYSVRTHNVGLLSLEVTNVALFGDPFSDALNAGWRGYEHLFLASLWVGGIGSDLEPHVSVGKFVEFRPELDPRSTIYDSYEGVEGGKRISLRGVDLADDDGDGLVDEDFQNGYDDDFDGMIDEDFAAVGQLMFSTMFRDDTPEALLGPNHVPLGLQVRQRTFQWSVTGINEMVGFEWEIRNAGDQHLTDLYIGLNVDSDVGPPSVLSYWSDDLVAVDRVDTSGTNPSAPGYCSAFHFDIPVVYTWDVPDNGSTIIGGDAPGVFGTVLLGHTTDVEALRAPRRVGWTTATWFSAAQIGPSTDAERYALMASGEVSGIATEPSDYRYITAVGPFSQFDPGESLILEGAFVVGDGLAGFRRNAVSAQFVYNGGYLDADDNPMTGIDGKEECLRVLEPGEILIWNDPCDTTAMPVQWSSTDCLWVDEDCNPCTGIYGDETHSAWVGRLAPPYPGTNLDPDMILGGFELHVIPPAGNGQVILQWDNLSETEMDPIIGLDLFLGYRIWKVSEWTIGGILPDFDDWSLIAEFRVDPENGQDPVEARPLTDAVNRDVEPIGITPGGRPIYPIGRYSFLDTEVVNDSVYLYSITAFGGVTMLDPDTMEMTLVEFSGIPFTESGWEVVPCATCGVVPVRLLSFTAERLGSGAVLRWTVQGEHELSGFRVHRQEPDAERVLISGMLAGAGTEFEFTDPAAPLGNVDYRLEGLTRTGETMWFGPVALEIDAGLPRILAGGPVTPNPFSSAMHLAYSLPDRRTVHAAVYDVRGRCIQVLTDSEQGPGKYTLAWTGETDHGVPAAPGVYLISIRAGAERITRRVLFLRPSGSD